MKTKTPTRQAVSYEAPAARQKSLNSFREFLLNSVELPPIYEEPMDW